MAELLVVVLIVVKIAVVVAVLLILPIPLTWVERKIAGHIQQRLGPMRGGVVRQHPFHASGETSEA